MIRQKQNTLIPKGKRFQHKSPQISSWGIRRRSFRLTRRTKLSETPWSSLVATREFKRLLLRSNTKTTSPIWQPYNPKPKLKFLQEEQPILKNFFNSKIFPKMTTSILSLNKSSFFKVLIKTKIISMKLILYSSKFLRSPSARSRKWLKNRGLRTRLSFFWCINYTQMSKNWLKQPEIPR